MIPLVRALTAMIDTIFPIIKPALVMVYVAATRDEL